jgi:hypothetical protein
MKYEFRGSRFEISSDDEESEFKELMEELDSQEEELTD